MPAAATHAAAPPAGRRLVRRAAPQRPSSRHATRRSARTVRVPVTRDSYSLLPPKAKAAKQTPDPFAAVPVVEDTVGGVGPDAAAPAVADAATIEDNVGVAPPDMPGQDDSAAAAPDVPPASAVPDDTTGETNDSTSYARGFRATGGAPTTPALGGNASASGETASPPAPAADATEPPQPAAAPTTSAPDPPASSDAAIDSSGPNGAAAAAPEATTVTAPAATTPAVASDSAKVAEAPSAAAPATANVSTTVWTVDHGTAKASPRAGKAWHDELRFGDGAAELVDATTGAAVADAVALAGVTSIVVVGSDADDVLTIDTQAPVPVPVAFDGGAGSDTLVGPATDATWAIRTCRARRTTATPSSSRRAGQSAAPSTEAAEGRTRSSYRTTAPTRLRQRRRTASGSTTPKSRAFRAARRPVWPGAAPPRSRSAGCR